MEWEDDAILLRARPFGESGQIVTVLTATHGRATALVRGGQSLRQRAMLGAGNELRVRWRGRLAQQLGYFTCEPMRNVAAAWFHDPVALAVIGAATALTDVGLPEQQPMPHVYQALRALLATETSQIWAPAYVRFELGLLQVLGYGLDLTRCAATGAQPPDVDLAYVSPKTGRAVTAAAGAAYHDKLLALPAFLWREGAVADAPAIAAGLVLTGHFLERYVMQQRPVAGGIQAALPAARQVLQNIFSAEGLAARENVA